MASSSGGHTSFAGAAGIEDGVTIDLGDIRDITYHESNETLSVGAGAVWGEVYEFVDREGIMVTGGRSSSVGMWLWNLVHCVGMHTDQCHRGWRLDSRRRKLFLCR